MRPSAATRPAFLAALASPFLRSRSTAFSISPSVSASAALQSIMPAPVISRSSLTICAVILAIGDFLDAFGVYRPASIARVETTRRGYDRAPISERSEIGRSGTALFGGKFLGLRDPALHAAWQSDFLADPVRGVG